MKTSMERLNADAQHCRNLAFIHARTFALASRLLPERKRRGAYALYAFCRGADDLVDLGVAGHGDSATIAARLGQYRRDTEDALAGSPSSAPFREVSWVAANFDVPRGTFFELLDGVALDLKATEYETWVDLRRYCDGVASSVGEMCAAVFGVRGDANARTRACAQARLLGVAMQLTNILRDVGEDAHMGRVYLPSEDLATYGLSRADILSGEAARHPGWRELMCFEIARARTLYRDAVRGIPLLEEDAQGCAIACADGYARILESIESNGYDTFSRRARVGMAAKAQVLLGAWRRRTPSFRDARGREGAT